LRGELDALKGDEAVAAATSKKQIDAAAAATAAAEQRCAVATEATAVANTRCVAANDDAAAATTETAALRREFNARTEALAAATHFINHNSHNGTRARQGNGNVNASSLSSVDNSLLHSDDDAADRRAIASVGENKNRC
jgi:hypothetical protein